MAALPFLIILVGIFWWFFFERRMKDESGWVAPSDVYIPVPFERWEWAEMEPDLVLIDPEGLPADLADELDDVEWLEFDPETAKQFMPHNLSTRYRCFLIRGVRPITKLSRGMIPHIRVCAKDNLLVVYSISVGVRGWKWVKCPIVVFLKNPPMRVYVIVETVR